MSPNSAENVLVAADALRRLAANILVATGVQSGDAITIADHLVEANRRGVDGHGVLRLHQYVRSVRAGHINRHPNVTLSRRGAVVVVDADGGYGFGPSELGMAAAIDIATSLGVGAASVTNSHHFGMASTYALMAADEGLVGVAISNTVAVLPPPGGSRPLIGNSPIAVALPRAEGDAVVADLALSVASWGKISLAAARGESIPLGWAYDINGGETTSAADALQSKMLAPIGGHKGFALAVLLELLVAGLAGAPVGPRADGHAHRQGGCGHLLVAFNPSRFSGRSAFLGCVTEFAEAAATLATSFGPTRLPGTRSASIRRERADHGIPIPQDIWESLHELAVEVGAKAP